LVRCACAWALGKFTDPCAERALSERQSIEKDAEVQAEIDHALAAIDAAQAVGPESKI
jgi:hypothetical protein